MTQTSTERTMSKKMQAVFNDTVIAESDDTIVVEGNHYFPASALKSEYVEATDTHTLCGWKGLASYFTVRVEGVASKDAAWYYPKPTPLARTVKDRVAFWHGVEVRPAPNAGPGEDPESYDAPQGATC